jgi:hypothetical protein
MVDLDCAGKQGLGRLSNSESLILWVDSGRFGGFSVKQTLVGTLFRAPRAPFSQARSKLCHIGM